MPPDELLEYVYHGREERNLEYKPSQNWKDEGTQARVVKAALALANLRDGGVIVLGVENDGANPTGMGTEDAASFNQDDVAALVNAYAEPFVELTVHNDVTEGEGKRFVVIQVREFAELPVIAKKRNIPENIREGGMYVRTRRMNESAEVSSQTEMREIVELATEKGIRRFFQTLGRVGIRVEEASESDRQKFEDQLGEL